MAYTIDRADDLAAQLEKFTTAFGYQVVGQLANLEFWMDEVRHALAVLDGYPRRFARMRDAQAQWVAAHKVVVGTLCAQCRGRCEFATELEPPTPPVLINAREVEAARRRLRDAGYRFLLRGHRMGLLDKAALRLECERIGTSVDLADIE